LLLIDKQSNIPLYEQIIKQYKMLIVQNVLKQHDRLPSVRKLSVELSINPNTLQKAYSELEANGICYSVAGRGRFVAKNARDIIKKDKDKCVLKLEESVFNLATFDVSYDEIIDIVDKTFKGAKAD
jgi:GntR family transcriptional regulator